MTHIVVRRQGAEAWITPFTNHTRKEATEHKCCPKKGRDGFWTAHLGDLRQSLVFVEAAKGIDILIPATHTQHGQFTRMELTSKTRIHFSNTTTSLLQFSLTLKTAV